MDDSISNLSDIEDIHKLASLRNYLIIRNQILERNHIIEETIKKDEEKTDPRYGDPHYCQMCMFEVRDCICYPGWEIHLKEVL